MIAFIISFIPLIILLLCNDFDSSQCNRNLIEKLFNANLTLFSVDITALAILFALFQDKKMDKCAKEAFKVQSISFISNAILQFLAIILAIVYFTCSTLNCIIFVCIVFIIQIWALLLVFDIIVELYTLISAIINKQ